MSIVASAPTPLHDVLPASEAAICFTKGTRILTPTGERPIETLRPGDAVVTQDHGAQELRWIGQRTVRASGTLAPICFLRQSIGNHRDLVVSPQHRMLCLAGRHERLAPAQDLIDNDRVSIAYGGMVTYLHVIFDRHEVIFAEGAASESFHPSDSALQTLADPAREELFTLFPALRSNPGGYGPVVRPCLPAQAAALMRNQAANHLS